MTTNDQQLDTERDQLLPTLESVLYSAGTDVGMRREENQDSYGIMLGEGYRLFIVADGMGGVKGGSIASNLSIAVVEKQLRDRAFLSVQDVVDALDKANAEVFKRGSVDEALQGMGTTFAALFLTATSAYTIHVGDSRVYKVSQGALTQLTEDHTLVQELVRSGAITPEQAEHHPVAHMLTRSIGPSAKIEIEVKEIKPLPKAGDRFVICSDGLFNLVKDEEIAEIVSEVSTDEAVQYLIDLANERGGTDNITILLIDTNDFAPQVKPVSVEKEEKTTSASSRLRETVEVVADSTASAGSATKGYHSTSDVAENEKAAIPASDDKPVQEAASVIETSESEYEEPATAEEEHYGDLIIDETVAATPIVLEAFHQYRRYILVGSGFLGGLLASYLFLSPAAHTKSSDFENASTPIEAIDPEPIAALVKRPVVQAPVEPVKIGLAEKTSVIKRRKDLEITLRDIDVRLALLAAEKSSDVEALQKTSAHRAEELSSKIEQLKTDIEVAIRQLATWYDRKRRLETSDKVNMASEMASTVPSIKTKKEEFEKITWDYLKEVEALRYNTADPAREQVLADLAKKRADKMKELSEEVRHSIEKSLESADDTVAELTLQRGALERELDTVRQELDFARTVSANDVPKIEALRQTLLTRKEAASTELNELQRLLADN